MIIKLVKYFFFSLFFIYSCSMANNLKKKNYKIIKVDSLEHTYIFYAKKDSNIYKIVSKKNKARKCDKSVKINKTYDLTLRSLLPDNYTMKYDLGGIRFNGDIIDFDDTTYRDIFIAKEIKNKCYIKERFFCNRIHNVKLPHLSNINLYKHIKFGKYIHKEDFYLSELELCQDSTIIYKIQTPWDSKIYEGKWRIIEKNKILVKGIRDSNINIFTKTKIEFIDTITFFNNKEIEFNDDTLIKNNFFKCGN